MTVNWGILATGNISNGMAQALQDSAEANLLAVASRTQEKADRFGEKWGIPNRYASYEALAADPAVDVVYIGTPHSHHYDNMLLCLNAGKHVLCEKAFTLNAPQAQDCIELARAKNLFLMEAMWTRFFPAIKQIQAWLQAGVIGDVQLVKADFCINIPYDPQHRLYNPALGGGALLDLGIYPLTIAAIALGLPDRTISHAHVGATGVDELDTMTLIYDSGASAQLSCSMRIHKPREAFIVGTKGYIKVHDIFFSPDRLTLHRLDQEPETNNYPYASNGYIHEVEEVHDCLRTGQTESTIMPLDESLSMMQLMDQFREEWGIHYPQE
jgi:predicted dehydrogenase